MCGRAWNVQRWAAAFSSVRHRPSFTHSRGIYVTHLCTVLYWTFISSNPSLPSGYVTIKVSISSYWKWLAQSNEDMSMYYSVYISLRQSYSICYLFPNMQQSVDEHMDGGERASISRS
jgi:hypothetical protein